MAVAGAAKFDVDRADGRAANLDVRRLRRGSELAVETLRRSSWLADRGRITAQMAVVQTIDSAQFSLKVSHDFGWLQSIGTVVDVFDKQDSGNICFTVMTANGKHFIKYAGAQTLNYSGEARAAVERLRKVTPVYADLQHDSLVRLLDAFAVGSGFACVFEWLAGENLHPYWKYPPPAKYTDPASPFYRFKRLSVETRLRTLGEILRFHVHVERKGYVAIDFYDGSLMYDFKEEKLRICDIDFYAKRPYRNTLGRLWGSSRFMSPEEYELNTIIDSQTNVYTMGAMAFCLLGSDTDRSISKWEGTEEQFSIVRKAVSPKRTQRQRTVEEFYQEWSRTIGHKGTT